MSPDTQPAAVKEQQTAPSFSLLSDDGNSQSSSFDRADKSDVGEGAAVDRDKPEPSQTSPDDCRALPETSTVGKGIEQPPMAGEPSVKPGSSEP